MPKKIPNKNNNRSRTELDPVFSAQSMRIILIALALWVGGGLWVVWGAPTHGNTIPNSFRWQSFLAPFHSVILHYPIGFVTIVCALEFVSFFRKQWELRRAIGITIVLSAMSAVLAAGLGWLRAIGSDYNSVMLEKHRWSGMAVTLFTIVTTAIYFKAYSSKSPKPWVFLYRTGLLSCLIALIVAGHQGGNLTHGSRYLTKNAPDFLKHLLEEPSDHSSDPVGQIYSEKIAPIFEAKCFSCHGSQKQKGKYRLDLPHSVLKTADGKLMIKPGAPLESELIRRVTLPRTHEDAMPPEDKPVLTSDEIMALVEWIHQGTVIDK